MVLPVPGGRHQQGPLHVLLAAHIGEVDVVAAGLREERVAVDDAGLQRQVAGQQADGVGQRADAVDLDALDHGRLLGVLARHNHATDVVAGGQQRHRQGPADRADAAVERQLTRDDVVGDGLAAQLVVAHQQPQRNRQVERRPLLLDVGGGEVDRRFGARLGIAGVGEGAAAAVDAFLDARVRQAHEVWHAEAAPGHVHLDLTGLGLDPDQRHAVDACQHSRLMLGIRPAGCKRPRGTGPTAPPAPRRSG